MIDKRLCPFCEGPVYDESSPYCSGAAAKLYADALREAIDLLDNARSTFVDPGLKRNWALRRKALRETLP